MSLPREIKEELLSAYMDDALSGDERERVEQILASDQEAKSLLERMRSIQASTRAAMQSSQRPADGFSERVVAAAIARAQQEQLPAQHHVQVAASRTGKTKPASPSVSRQRRTPVAVALALAASLLLAVTLWNAFPNQDGTGGVANLQPDVPANDDPSVASTDDASRGVVTDPVAEPTETPREEPSGTASEARPEPEALATADPDRQPMEGEPSVNEDRRAAPRSSAPETDQAIDDPAASLAMQAVMMFEVEQTDVGRENNAVLREMLKAGIQADRKQRINNAIVEYLQQARLVADPSDTSNAADASSPVSVMYVEASGKQLDRFMLSLFGDTEQIARIGWNMAMDAPVVEAASQIEKVIATDVRHAESEDAATAWQLVTDDAQQGFMASETDREFFPIDRSDAAGWGAISSANAGADIRSRLLILIR